jgi:hypothetical protein
MARWIPVGDELPDTYESVFFSAEKETCIGHWDGWEWYDELRLDADDCSPTPVGGVTHWTPIDWPEPPEVD